MMFFLSKMKKGSASLTGFGITLKQPKRIHSQGSLKELDKPLIWVLWEMECFF